MTEDERLLDDVTRTEDEGVTLDLPPGLRGFVPGQVLGERYQVRALLGRGGMGEVWHAFDLKLRVEVALKALREDLFKSERRRELLRQEVRAAREVVSPNVCRIFDLIEIEGRELVSMEYVDGATLLAVLLERGPLELKEAQDIASQFLAGLEAIHKAGLIHRDIKPENIMLTRAGRVVVMDFGLARQETEGGGTVSGTPAYMAPEQAAGQTLDARADVYAAGVVLAEMVCPEGIKSIQSRQSVWEGVRSEPAKVPDTPWAQVIKKAVAKDREGRYRSAHTLTRALEDVTLRVEGAEDLHPYPGLASFTESDAEYFFGREAEVEQMWRKLEGPPRMLGMVGPSGAGKTSFLRAGLIPAASSAWATAVCTPGTNPVLALSRALAAELAGDADAVDLLLRFDGAEVAVEVVGRWRRRAGRAVLIVDQFEELFTQNGSEVQQRFSDLLHRLVLDADVHVLLSMRDDFLFRCHEHPTLAPIFSELTPLGAPTGAALRRALTQPALQCGYRFEDDELVDEMLAEVEGERGALPLLAFAAARLWEKRDRETGLLTRQAHHDIGGVGGALARHAEATVDRIGHERLPTVRELFRNLVTAEGTRAVREWDELLSVFCDSSDESPEEVLRQLIDARLLTSYEVREADEAPTRRVEIIHESLLANWPRLVRWQTQDADAAQLRDQLRQAAKTWDEHGRSDDTLWTGSAYREFAVWRERYPGGLTELEEAFASAMTSLATRRRRRRRVAAVAALALALAVAAVFGGLWRRSVQETRRAEAAKLLAMAQVQLDTDPTEALAFSTTSLEIADTREGRILAMRTLWKASPVRVLVGAGLSGRVPKFSPDGCRLATSGNSEEVLVYHQDGGEPLRLGGHPATPHSPSGAAWPSNDLVVTSHGQTVAHLWEVPTGQLLRTIRFSRPTWSQVGEGFLFGETEEPSSDGGPKRRELLRWRLPHGEADRIGSIDLGALGVTSSRFDELGERWLYSRGQEIFCRMLPAREDITDVLVGHHDNAALLWVPQPREPMWIPQFREPEFAWSQDAVTGERRFWSLVEPSTQPLEVIPPPPQPTSNRYAIRCGDGRWRVFQQGRGAETPQLWDVQGLEGNEPLQLLRHADWYESFMDIHPSGRWLVASAGAWDQLVFWPLRPSYPSIVKGHSDMYGPVAFSPDGAWLATGWSDGGMRLWPVPGTGGRLREFKSLEPSESRRMAFDAQGRQMITVGFGTELGVVSLDGHPFRKLDGFSRNHLISSGAFSPSGRFAAAGTSFGNIEKKILRIWDLETDQVRVFDLEHQRLEVPDDRAHTKSNTGYENGIRDLAFIDDSTLLTAGTGGLRKWDLRTGLIETVIEESQTTMTSMASSSDRTKILTLTWHNDRPRIQPAVVFHDLVTRESRTLDEFGTSISSFVIDPSGRVALTGGSDGIVHVGWIDGGDPHVLVGHDGPVKGVAISPDLRWAATVGQDKTLRLWPMPDLSKPPLHTLPHDELIAKLKSLTNLRAVRDPESATGWKIEVDPFPGWAEVPEW